MRNETTASGRRNTKVMNRFDLTKRLVARLKNEEAVIGGIGNTNFDLWAAERRPQNFYMLGSMGLAVPIALGVALAQPQRKVIALEGDGSILMQVGSLATVAARAQVNLAIVIMDNGTYQIPLLLLISERGTLGEFYLGQAMVCRSMRPIRVSLGIEEYTITRFDELAFILDRSIKQAVAIQAPVTFILSPLLTGGKVFAK
jgi:thiamine pyrophosphate-dependent acetolactate synthase large subunit-like protein